MNALWLMSRCVIRDNEPGVGSVVIMLWPTSSVLSVAELNSSFGKSRMLHDRNTSVCFVHLAKFAKNERTTKRPAKFHTGTDALLSAYATFSRKGCRDAAAKIRWPVGEPLASSV